MSYSTNINPDETLYQYFTKEHLDPSNYLTSDQWQNFVDAYQSGFADAASACAAEMMSNYRQSLVLDTID